MSGKYIGGVIAIAVLWVLWPNLVHEPLHWFALWLQGINGTIHFGLHPFIVRSGMVQGIAGGLFFLLLPSLVSVAILTALLVVKPKFLTHFVLGPYLAFDLFMNIRGRWSSTSDFYFLTAVPHWVGSVLAAAAVVLGFLVMLRGIRVVQGGGEHGKAVREGDRHGADSGRRVLGAAWDENTLRAEEEGVVRV